MEGPAAVFTDVFAVEVGPDAGNDDQVAGFEAGFDLKLDVMADPGPAAGILLDNVFDGIWIVVFDQLGDEQMKDLEYKSPEMLFAVIFDTDGKNFIKTPTFFVMKLFKEHLENYLLENAFEADEKIDALASISEDESRVALTAANRDLYNEGRIILSDELKNMKPMLSDIVRSSDVRNYNRFDAPDLIKDEVFAFDKNELLIPSHSVVRIVFTK